jgi:hypothetical protein
MSIQYSLITEDRLNSLDPEFPYLGKQVQNKHNVNLFIGAFVTRETEGHFHFLN